MEHALASALRAMNTGTYNVLTPSPTAVSTMTVTAQLNVSSVCRDKLLVAVGWMEGEGPLTAERKPTRPTSRPPKPDFNNQTTVRYGSKSIKMFRNGSVHVTGCKSMADFVQAVSAVCDAMTQAGIEPGGVRVTGFDTQMINVTFNANATLGLRELRELCLMRGWGAMYDADVYPGLNVKIPVCQDRRVTALVFRSGSVILTGAKTAAHVQEAHQQLTRILDEMVQAAQARAPPEINS